LFKGEKRALFWIGLIILALASVILFATLWQFAFIEWYHDVSWMVRQSFPIMFGAVVFILVGLYMMKSGIKKP
jgi:hypothetical protein